MPPKGGLSIKIIQLEHSCVLALSFEALLYLYHSRGQSLPPSTLSTTYENTCVGKLSSGLTRKGRAGMTPKLDVHHEFGK